MIEGIDLGVLEGDKPLIFKPEISNEDYLKLGLILFLSFFVSVLLANAITR